MRKAYKKREEKMKKVIAKVLVALCFIAFSYGLANADIKVYDSNRQFLGYGFVYETQWGLNEPYINVYVPSLSRFITLSTITGDIPYVSGEIGDTTVLEYESFDCSGTPYIWAQAAYKIERNGNKFYTGQDVAPALNNSINSFYSEGECIVSPWEEFVVPAKDVTRSMPFRIPVSLPFKFKLD